MKDIQILYLDAVDSITERNLSFNGTPNFKTDISRGFTRLKKYYEDLSFMDSYIYYRRFHIPFNELTYDEFEERSGVRLKDGMDIYDVMDEMDESHKNVSWDLVSDNPKDIISESLSHHGEAFSSMHYVKVGEYYFSLFGI